MKFQVLYFILGIKKKKKKEKNENNFFSLLDAKGFKTTPKCKSNPRKEEASASF